MRHHAKGASAGDAGPSQETLPALDDDRGQAGCKTKAPKIQRASGGTALARYDSACRALAEAVVVDEVMAIRDEAAQLAAAARVANNHKAEADAVAIRMRATRRLGQLMQAQKESWIVLVVEGEAKVDLLWSWNMPATACAEGVKKWKPELAQYLRGADVIILGDHDRAGAEHIDVVGASLQDTAASVRVLNLPGLGPCHRAP